MIHGTILIIDDDPTLLQATARLLEHEGWQVETYDDSDEALERARENAVECLIVDLNMPHVSGLTMLRKLRAEGITTPVILVSGEISDVDEAAARRIVNTTTMQKPLAGAVLNRRIKEALDRSEFASRLEQLRVYQEELQETVATLHDVSRTPEACAETARAVAVPLVREAEARTMAAIPAQVERLGFLSFLRIMLTSWAFHGLLWPSILGVGGMLLHLQGETQRLDAATTVEGRTHERDLKTIRTDMQKIRESYEQFRGEQHAIRADLQEIKKHVVTP